MAMTASSLADPRRGRGAVIVSHAQHLFKVLGWIEQMDAQITILTDGSGAGPWGPVHTAALGGVLTALGARPGEIFGLLPDIAVYDALLRGDAGFFTAIVDRIAAALLRDDVDLVVGDALEGYNPAHDLCRAMIDAAVTLAERRSDRAILSYEFFLAEWLDAARKTPRPDDLELVLDAKALDRKLTTALQFEGWRPELLEVIGKLGEAYFAREYLRPVQAFAPPLHGDKPEYESFGEARVAAGGYAQVIRYHRHVRPMLEAIRAHALDTAPRHAAAR